MNTHSIFPDRVRRSMLRHYMVADTLYRLACDHDVIERSAMFAVFSHDNPWANKLDRIDEVGSDVIGFRVTVKP